ncbi:MAG: ribosomal protein S18-alanine N-acetyltransferase [Parvularculaceae bacterium]
MRDWIIRRARLDDIELLSRLEEQAFGDMAWGGGAMADGMTANAVATLLAYGPERQAPFGFVMWRPLGDEAEILTLGVSPDGRRKGVASALLARSILDARQAGAARMFLEVGARNVAAIALYRKFGFEQIGERPSYYRDGEDALVMRARIG